MSAPYERESPARAATHYNESVRASGGASVGDLLADVSRDLSTLMRQEVELAKAEAKDSASKASKAASLLGGAGLGAHMAALFLSIAAWWGIGDATGHAISALIVAAVWALIAAMLALVGRKELHTMTGLQRTAATAKQIPPALKGDA
jgi:hypothetical protein